MSLTSLTNIKLLLSIDSDDTSEDDLLNLLIGQADVIIENNIDRRIEEATYTEYYSGSGDERLFLNNYPVSSITSINVDNGGFYGDGTDAFPASSLLTEGTDYVLDKDDASQTEVSRSGTVYKIGGVWTRPQIRKQGQLCSAPGTGKGNIKVVYVAGYDTVPLDIQHCANRLVVSLYKSKDKAGKIVSESFEDYSYSLASLADEVGALDSIQSVLSRYRRIVI